MRYRLPFIVPFSPSVLASLCLCLPIRETGLSALHLPQRLDGVKLLTRRTHQKALEMAQAAKAPATKWDNLSLFPLWRKQRTSSPNPMFSSDCHMHTMASRSCPPQ